MKKLAPDWIELTRRRQSFLVEVTPRERFAPGNYPAFGARLCEGRGDNMSLGVLASIRSVARLVGARATHDKSAKKFMGANFRVRPKPDIKMNLLIRRKREIAYAQRRSVPNGRVVNYMSALLFSLG